MLGFSTQHPTVSCGTERPHLPPLGPAGVTNPPLGWPIVTKPRFRPSVSTAKSRYFNNLRLPHQTHTRPTPCPTRSATRPPSVSATSSTNSVTPSTNSAASSKPGTAVRSGAITSPTTRHPSTTGNSCRSSRSWISRSEPPSCARALGRRQSRHNHCRFPSRPTEELHPNEPGKTIPPRLHQAGGKCAVEGCASIR